MRTVTDEKGVKHTTCHGVPADIWFEFVHKTIRNLSKPEFREQHGISRIDDAALILCSDPDCKRLNRRMRSDQPQRAIYMLVRDLPPVKVSNPKSLKDKRLCNGHPWQAGNYLCRSCAIIGVTKRMIDAARQAITHFAIDGSGIHHGNYLECKQCHSKKSTPSSAA